VTDKRGQHVDAGYEPKERQSARRFVAKCAIRADESKLAPTVARKLHKAFAQF
jgi:hypothetical protein